MTNADGEHLFENPAQPETEDAHEYGQRPPYKQWYLAEKEKVKQLEAAAAAGSSTTDNDVQKKVEGKLNKLGVDKIKALSRDLTGDTAARKAAAVTAIAQHLLA